MAITSVYYDSNDRPIDRKTNQYITGDVNPVVLCESFEEFCDKYMDFKLDKNWHHRLFMDILENKVLQDPDDGLIYDNFKKIRGKNTYLDTTRRNQNILVMAPRFHAKSTIFSIAYPLYKIYENPNIRILIVSANQDIAVSFNRAIMSHLEGNDKLRQTFGSLVPIFDKRKWGEQAIIVKRKSHEKDPTVAAVGVGGKLISKRADIILCDDIIDLESARTKQARNKTQEWFENVLLPILETETGQLIVVGTAWYRGDIYDHLWKDSMFNIKLKLKALVYHKKYFQYRTKGGREVIEKRFIPFRVQEFPKALDVCTVFSETGLKKYELYERCKQGVLWPAKWNFEQLMERKSNMSSGSFMRQFLNEPGSEEERLFKEVYIKEAFKRGAKKCLQPSWDNSNPPETHFYGYKHLIVAIGIDLAISKKSTSDNTAIAVWGLADNRDRVLLNIITGKFSPEETKQKIIEFYHSYNPVKVRVETVAFQDMMRQELAEEIPIEGFHTTAGNKFNESSGLGSIAMLLEQGKVVIPQKASTKEENKSVSQLIADLQDYAPGQHAGDCLMASWFALDALKEFDKKLSRSRGYFNSNYIVDQMKKMTAASRIVLFGYNPPSFHFSHQSLISVYAIIQKDAAGTPMAFFQPSDKFFVYFTRTARSIGYVFDRMTSKIIAKLDGDMTAMNCVNLLEKLGRFFNSADIIIDRSGEGEAIFQEMQKRFYPKLRCFQPDKSGNKIYKEGFEIEPSNLPLSIDYFKSAVESGSLDVADDAVLRDMTDLIDVDGNQLVMAFGDGQRLKTAATGLWLLENYNVSTRNPTNKKQTKIVKKMSTPYRVFNYK